MGNCQAVEAATVVIEYPGNNKIERIYQSVSVGEVMNSNPGHYVALLITSSTLKSSDHGSTTTTLKHLKLLRPHDTLLIGHVYRLITFEGDHMFSEVVKEFAAKKCARLGKILKETGGLGENSRHTNPSALQEEQELRRMGTNGRRSNNNTRKGSSRRHCGGGGQWRPALQSIAESGT